MGPAAALSPDVPSANELGHLGIYAAFRRGPHINTYYKELHLVNCRV